MLAEKVEKCAQLKWRREQLENERSRIMQNLELIKSGDMHTIKRGEGVNFGLISAKNIIGDMKSLEMFSVPGMKDKMKAEEERIK